jgi:hypothetical protein
MNGENSSSAILQSQTTLVQFEFRTRHNDRTAREKSTPKGLAEAAYTCTLQRYVRQ